ncbi:TPA: hypothetical protein N0F65_004093 [Lagenidium giganteum]|uniref:DIRP domain-containing protein n=1 Tax=Lagenidium giganteum TaxID=4803 RepID=A0AAV2ZBJ7_9STRA|nr:TPA: hypothetical protein N0F65_004093 [Lagenidium giganteum]
MLALNQFLGPRWSQKELRTFYILLRAHGKQWERFPERLPHRTVAMVRALYDMHRGYLSLPEASAEGFCTIMMDHYDNLEELVKKAQERASEDVAKRTTSASSATEMAAATATAGDQGGVAPALASTSAENTQSVAATNAGKNAVSLHQLKRKRKLDKFLARDDQAHAPKRPHVADGITQQAAAASLSSAQEVNVKAEPMASNPTAKTVTAEATVASSRSRPRKQTTPMRCRRWLGDVSAQVLTGSRFDLPWYNWFYSFLDVDFFHHNEFIDCLARMGLGKITTAARPIWSSVRASMGHPRRLSPCFFAQEKLKLESYRSIKRSISNNQAPPQSWPYRSPVPLNVGSHAVVFHAQVNRFLVGIVEHYDVQEGTCAVKLDAMGLQAVYTWPLSDVMLLQQTASDAPTTNVDTRTMRQGSGALQTTRTAGTNTTEHDVDVQDQVVHRRRTKISAMLVLKDLLRRKEQIVGALARMNEQASERNAVFADTASHQHIVQQQYAWLHANLEETNEAVNAALLRFQEPGNAAGGGNGQVDPLASQTEVDPDAMHGPLSMDHMRWALRFLSASQTRSQQMVSRMMQQLHDEPSQKSLSNVLPETQALISNCISLMCIARRVRANGSADHALPPLVTQKLLERMLEMLQPRHATNMDLYVDHHLNLDHQHGDRAQRAPLFAHADDFRR